MRREHAKDAKAFPGGISDQIITLLDALAEAQSELAAKPAVPAAKLAGNSGYNPTDDELRTIVDDIRIGSWARNFARLVLREREAYTRAASALLECAEQAEALASEWKAYEWKARVERDEARARAEKAEAERDQARQEASELGNLIGTYDEIAGEARAALARVEALCETGVFDVRGWGERSTPFSNGGDKAFRLVRAAIAGDPPAAPLTSIEEILTPEQRADLNTDLTRIAATRRRGEAAAHRLVIGSPPAAPTPNTRCLYCGGRTAAGGPCGHLRDRDAADAGSEA